MCANILKQKSQQSIIELSSPIVASPLKQIVTVTETFLLKLLVFGEVITSHVIHQIINEKIH